MFFSRFRIFTHLHRALFCLLAIVPAGVKADVPPPLQKPALMVDNNQSNPAAGYIQLVWKPKKQSDDKTRKPDQYELFESRDESFSGARLLYRGQNTASFLSGKRDGTYYYRVKVIRGNGQTKQSAQVKVTIQHHSLLKMSIFFSIGALVFIATLLVMFNGSRKHARGNL